ncbi:MAG: AlpA family phage regulatory protein [Paraburkholderia tropica]|uniref:helix-turn-helix transcriptional regulator n=1 Tax=Burkholderia gladioli TaxID=28095 RepID=UPI0016421855|nr:AlpA family phage regulatory protein [Burkholderia gladioli]
MARKTSIPLPSAPLAPGHMLRFVDLRAYLRLSKHTILDLERTGRFPHAIRYGPRCTLWRSDEVIEWLKDPAGYRAPWMIASEASHAR